MATVKLLSDDELSHEARVIFDDIRRTRQSDFVNNFWRASSRPEDTWPDLGECQTGDGAGCA